jgi:hypothetical protein
VSVPEFKKRVSGGGFRPFAIRDKRGFINNINPLRVVSAGGLSHRNGGF